MFELVKVLVNLLCLMAVFILQVHRQASVIRLRKENFLQLLKENFDIHFGLRKHLHAGCVLNHLSPKKFHRMVQCIG
jgi:hypothetical protein